MPGLDDIDELKEFNKSFLADSIREIEGQVEQVFEELTGFEFPSDYKNINNIVVCGMGGSGLGMRIFQSVYFDKVKVPTELINGYKLPAYVGEKSLVMLCSYSGTTEEVLSCGEEAEKKGAKMVYFCAKGGKLAEIGKSKNWVGYSFEPKNNPSGQPRMGLGYAITAQIMMLAKLGVVSFGEEEKELILSAVREANQRFNETVMSANNQAKSAALLILGRQLAVVGSEHLRGSAWVLRNQVHENSKNYANAYFLPELNHHLLEGLGFPEGVSERLYFIFLQSENFSKRVRQRYEVTKKVLDKQKIDHMTFVPDQKMVLGEVFEVLVFGSWVSYYLAYLNGIDPAPIPFVSFFKEELDKLQS